MFAEVQLKRLYKVRVSSEQEKASPSRSIFEWRQISGVPIIQTSSRAAFHLPRLILKDFFQLCQISSPDTLATTSRQQRAKDIERYNCKLQILHRVIIAGCLVKETCDGDTKHHTYSLLVLIFKRLTPLKTHT